MTGAHVKPGHSTRHLEIVTPSVLLFRADRENIEREAMDDSSDQGDTAATSVGYLLPTEE